MNTFAALDFETANQYRSSVCSRGMVCVLYCLIVKLCVCLSIAIDLREEPWGDRHFAIVDPNGIGIDIVTYSAPE